MRKTLLILLCVLLITAMTLTFVFAFAGSASIAASADTATPGQTVEFVASLADFPQADSMSVKVTVPAGLTLQKGEWVLGGFMADFNSTNKNGVWASTSTQDLTARTDVFKLTCVVNEPAAGQAADCEVKMVFKVKANGSSVGEVEATASVTVVNPATSLELNKQTMTLDLSGTVSEQLTATIGPENTTDTLSWESSDDTVATVAADGTVTAVAEGEATITATVGALSKSCAVTVTCLHTNMTESPAATSTCQVAGNNQYYTCDTCGDVFKADRTTATTVVAETLALTDCAGGTPTCTEQAKCQWCQQPYGETLPHSFTEQIEDAAHFVAGSGEDCQDAKVYYYDCADCDTVSTDKTFASTQKGDHRIATEWTSENGQHYRKCTVTGCAHTEQEAACDFTARNTDERYLVSGATCTEKAVYTFSCTVCAAAGTETFQNGDTLPHDFSEKLEDAAHFVAGSGADCQHFKAYYYDCADCDAISPDSTFESTVKGEHQVSNEWTTENEKHYHKCTVTGCTYITDEAECAGGTASCTQLAVCAACQQTYGQLKPHDYSEQWTSTGTTDNDKHYQLCITCQVAKQGEGNHSFGWIVDDPATEDKTGLKHEECSVCGVKRNEGAIIEKLDHVHIGITHHDPVKSTCVATGTVEYWTCSSAKCEGKYYSDSNCQLELNDITEQIDSDNHPETEVRDAQIPSCYQPGYTGDTWCTACVTKIGSGEPIPATEAHIAGAEWFSDNTDHWHICTTEGCGAIVSKAAHSYQWIVDDPATEDKTGLKHEECVCGVKRNMDTVIEKLDHVHIGITHHEAVKATCVATGTVEYWTCSSAKCEGKYYSDDKCQLEIAEITEAINKDNHAGIYVKNAVAATCSQTGYSGDTWCSKCNVQVEKGYITAATEKHTAAGKPAYDNTVHWSICGCGAVFGKADHTPEVVDAKAATTTEVGYTGDKVCSVCGYVTEKGEEIPMETVPAPTETEPAETTEPETTEPVPGTDENKGNGWILPVILAAALLTILIFLLNKKRKR